MSGRKASEVSSLLSKGQEARQAGEHSLDKTFERCKSNITINQNEINEIIETLNNINIEISKEASQEFETESEKIQNHLIKLKKTITKKSYDINSLEKSVESANNNLRKLDYESEEIKRRIIKQSHYCDNEYRDASILVEKYKVIANEKNTIKNKINELNGVSNIDIEFSKSILNQASKTAKEIETLNQRAKDIVILRNESKEAKKFIIDLFNEIDEILAHKFMKDDYEVILNEKNKFVKMNDCEVVKKLNSTTGAINNFKHNLHVKYEEYKLEKVTAEGNLKNINVLIKTSEYYNPMEYIKKREKCNSINILEFLKDYANGEYTDEIQKGIREIENLIEKEMFKDADERSEEVNNLIEKAMLYSTIKQEKLIKNATLALDIRNVMRKMNYSTRAEIIDNDINSGFKVTCEVGDEIIEFDRVIVNDAGEVTIDIDHTESVKGTCGAKWSDIQQSLKSEGIFIQDITKNGNSILYPNRSVQSNESHKIQRK